MRHRKQRRGAILVSALVCLMVSLSLVSTMIAGTLHRRAQLKTERQARQAMHLLIAGHDRARHQLRLDRGYAGETWQAAVSEDHRGEVRIKAAALDSGLTEIEITALFPLGDPQAVRRSGTFYLSIPVSTEKKSS